MMLFWDRDKKKKLGAFRLLSGRGEDKLHKQWFSLGHAWWTSLHSASCHIFLCRGIHFIYATVGNPYLFPGNDWSKHILPGLVETEPFQQEMQQQHQQVAGKVSITAELNNKSVNNLWIEYQKPLSKQKLCTHQFAPTKLWAVIDNYI